MPEVVVDGGETVAAGHASSRLGGRRRRPDGIPEEWVYDRQAREWREPRKPGPKPGRADGGADRDGDRGDAAGPGPQEGWRADRDPDPAHLAAGQPPRGERPRVSQEIKDDVAGLLGLLAVPVGQALAVRDPYCGGVLAGQLPEIVDRMVPLVCRSQRVVAWLSADTGGLMDWIGLAAALAPVARAVAEHHVLRTVEIVPDDDHAGEPRAAAADYSAYTAA
jgi:hypothetical protein